MAESRRTGHAAGRKRTPADRTARRAAGVLVAALVLGAGLGGPRAACAADMRDGVGLAAGLPTGLGFSYIHHDPLGWAAQATAILLRSGGRAWYSLGAGGQYTLAGSPDYRIYTALNGAFFRHNPSNRPSYTDFNIGLGLGIEGLYSGPIGLSAELDEMWKTRTGGVVLAPAVAMHYYF